MSSISTKYRRKKLNRIRSLAENFDLEAYLSSHNTRQMVEVPQQEEILTKEGNEIVQEDETVQDEIFPDSFQELINGDAPQDQPFYFYSDDLLSGINSQNSEKIIFALLIALFYSANFTQIQLKKTIEWA